MVASGPNSLIRDQVDTPSPGKGTMPWPGLMPTSPQLDAGMRIEPPPSTARATGTMAAATAAALPPEEPPGVWSRLQGLRATPNASLSVNGHRHSSGTLVLPTSSAPAARRRRTGSASVGGRLLAGGRRADAGRRPGQVDVVLDRHRHPGQRQPVQVVRGSRRALASALTASVRSSWNAPSRRSRAAIRSRCSSSTSVGVARPAWTAAAIPTAVSPTKRPAMATSR